MMTTHAPFILASASPRRLQLLKQAGLTPAQVLAADIDETPQKNELPVAYAARLSAEKAAKIAQAHPEAVILAADTVVALGRRILPKAEDEATATKCLSLLNGRRHRVHTSITVIAHGKARHTLVTTQVKMSRLTSKDIAAYVATSEWHGKAGGYGIQGIAETFIPWIGGSYSNVVGLPLAETCKLLAHAGIKAPANRQASPERCSMREPAGSKREQNQ